MDRTTMINKRQILSLDVGTFYSALTQKDYENIYNIMAENFSHIVSEENYLNAFLDFFKETAKTYEDDYLINIEMFVEIFLQELDKRKKD